MADKRSQAESKAEFISNFENITISMECKSCENLELQLSHTLSELSSPRLIVDLLSKECNRVQSEPPVNTTITKKWTQVSYTHEKLPTLQQRSKTADRTLHQHIPETRNRFEILSNPSAGLDNYKIENKTVKQAGEQGGDLLPSDTNAEGNGSRTYKNEQDDSDTSNWRWRK